MNSRGTTRVARRRVFYIPGFDPMPARRYRELYRSEGARQAEISGYEIDTRAGPDPTAWRVRAEIGDDTTLSRIDVLTWSDIVRESMSTNLLGTYIGLVRTAWFYLSSGALRRLSWLAKGPVLAALYPIVMLLAQLLLAVLVGAWLGGLLADGARWVAGLLGLAGAGVTLAATALQWMVALPVILLILRWFKSKDDKLFAHYLMHDYAFTSSKGGAYLPALEERLASFRTRVAAALEEEVDEILIIGHSSGAHLAVSVVADLLRDDQVSAFGPRLSLMTLGQVIPMVSFLPNAGRLRKDLHLLAGSDAITWIDISAPGDGCCFALSDPVAVSGVSPPGAKWPLVLSAAFSKTLSVRQQEDLRHRYFRLHFQYLCAFERPGVYDYFQITAGPLTLAQRFHGRRPSRLRIDVAASRFSDLVA